MHTRKGFYQIFEIEKKQSHSHSKTASFKYIISSKYLTGLEEQTVLNSTVHSDRSAGLMLMCRDGRFILGRSLLNNNTDVQSISQRKRKPHLTSPETQHTQEKRSSVTHLNMTISRAILAHVFSKSQY